MNIKVELRSLITKEQYHSLQQIFLKQGKLLQKDDIVELEKMATAQTKEITKSFPFHNLKSNEQPTPNLFYQCKCNSLKILFRKDRGYLSGGSMLQ